MGLRLQIILIIAFALAIIFILNLCRKKKLELKHGLPWLLVLVVMLILSIFPNIISACASLLGIQTPINMLVLFIFFFMACLVLNLTIIISRLSDNIKRLVQKIAILENESKENKEGKY